ncbi:uncharacterized protein MAM_03654 [Metarhizium album ARSEF 1941]|uniref:Uncharacterized protein n=1 Tax=Metarhizium album (strain ARSEF 1941) TaxID=1081103 RepID=A0A0B2X0A7_METAS|nr:uncharacterized protein MAM_03654 [Metarhizium album ARSEF 1941]KHN98530.1 hypothetical protein MAM_03654 [Metarhizium album ARSEF 1941]
MDPHVRPAAPRGRAGLELVAPGAAGPTCADRIEASAGNLDYSNQVGGDADTLATAHGGQVGARKFVQVCSE